MGVSLDGVDYSFGSRLPENAERSYQFMIVRLLLGSVAITHLGTTSRSVINHSVFPGVLQEQPPAVAMKNFMQSYGISGGVRRFIRVTTADNRTFYQNLLAEFANFEIEKGRGSHASAFVFLYRILERLSFSVPLLYCSTSRDYAGTFNDLRAMFGADNDKSGEHGFFKKFIAQGRMIDHEVLNSTYSIDFSTAGDNGPRFYSEVTKHSDKFLNGDESTCYVEIKCVDVADLIRNVRNRFFHARTGDGQKNISLINIRDANGMFSCLNDVFYNFLAIVVLQSIAKKYAA